MKLICKAEVTVLMVKDIKSYTRYYQALPADDVAPPVPASKDPPVPWQTSEPDYDGTNMVLYYTDLTAYSDGSFSYSPISRLAESGAIIQLAQTLQGTNSDLDSLKDTLRQSEESLTQQQDEILAKVAETYVSKTDNQTMQEQLQTSIDQNNKEIRMDFNESFDSVNNQISQNRMDLHEYIRFSGGTIELGKIGNDFMTVLSNTELAFMESGAKVAYVSDNAMKITDAEIDHKLSLGQSTKGWFDFVPRENGNLSIKWRTNDKEAK